MSLAHLSKTLFLILLASSVLLSGCRSSVFVRPPALRQDISHDQLVQRFEGIAFFNEFTSDETGLRKRTAPVTWRLETSGGKDAKTSVVRILYQLAKLTGLTFTEAQPPERPSLEILIKPRAELIEHLIKAGSTHQGYIYDTLCWGRYRSAPNGAIMHVLVAIPNHLETGEVETCLWIEITQGLGLPNDLDDLKPSIYSDAPYLTVGRLPWYDAILVRTLYDARLQPGMSRARAMPLVRIILKELLAKRDRVRKKVSS